MSKKRATLIKNLVLGENFEKKRCHDRPLVCNSRLLAIQLCTTELSNYKMTDSFIMMNTVLLVGV